MCDVPYGKSVLNNSDLIFIGTVKSDNQVTEENDIFHRYNHFVSFDKNQIIKGKAPDDFNIYYHDGIRKMGDQWTRVNPSFSSKHLIKEKEYIIFSKYDEHSQLYRFTACGRNFIRIYKTTPSTFWYENIITLYAVLDLYPELLANKTLTKMAEEMLPILKQHKKHLCEESEDQKNTYTKRTLDICD